MRRLRYLPLPSLLVSLLVSTSVSAAPWVEDKAFFSDNKSLPSSKVDAADLNGDGTIDLVFANGAGFDKGDKFSNLQQQAFINDGGTMTDVSSSIFQDVPYAGRAVKLRDIDRDGDNDIILGTTWETQSQLLLNDGGGVFVNATAENLPQGPASVGDLELGDVDGDGDLDMILSNWGPTGAQTVATNSGGVTMLWTQMGKPAEFGGVGTAMFDDVTLNQMPNLPVRWSWELEFIDFDNDYDLDIVISANAGEKTSVFLFLNDGAGKFVDATSGAVPQGRNGLDLEPMDLNGDGWMDLLSLHDGTGGRNRLLINNKAGKFTDGTDILWPKVNNDASYDTMGAFYDYDSNGKVDFLLGAFQDQYPDRLVYESAGKFKVNKMPFEEVKASNGTFAIVLADFNKDARLDVAMSQNENALSKEVLLASDEVPVDTVAPFLTNIESLDGISYPGTASLRLRSHDNKSPLMLHDFKSTDGKGEGFPTLEYWTAEPELPLDDHPGTLTKPGTWYGEYLWRIAFEVPDAKQMWYRLCATDANDNRRCTDITLLDIIGGTASDSDTNTDSATDSNATDSNATDSNATDSNATDSESDSESNSESNSESVTESASDTKSSDSDSNSDSTPTESDSDSKGSQSNSDTNTEVDSNSDSNNSDTLGAIDDDGCGCDANGSPVGGTLASLALLGLLGIRRRRNA